MVLLARVSYADEVNLQYATLALDSLKAADKTSGTLTMVRLDKVQNDPWAVFHCFEVRIKNPYKFSLSRQAYKAFNTTEKPICESTNKDIRVKCRYRSSFILQFWFEHLSDAAADSPSQEIKIGPFQNPHSSQVLADNTLLSFSDSQCLKPSQQKKLPEINIQPRISSGLTLKAGNQWLGDTQANNTLKITIEDPDVNMAKGSSGQLEVHIPQWYSVEEVTVPAFTNMMCSSECMNFQWAWAHSNILYLKYKQLSNQCRKDGKVIFTCRGYRNPISPGNMNENPVTILTFDNEKFQKPVAKLTGKFDSSDFFHVLIPNESLKVESVATKTLVTTVIPAQGNQSDQTETKTYKSYKVLLDLPVPIPMEKNCWIRVVMPKSLSIVTETTIVKGYGIFESTVGTDFTIASPGAQRQYVFEGCHSLNGIGAQPYGRLEIHNVQRKLGAVGTGGHFVVDIFGDSNLQELIARIDAGPSAGIIVDQGQGQGVNQEHSTTKRKSAADKQIEAMNQLLGTILLRQYMAEAKKDWDSANEFKIQADAMILKIREVKNVNKK